jgi:hypothetical protein
LERAIQEVWALFKETDRKIEKSSLETDRKFKETDRKIQEVSKNVGNLTGKWSRFVEGLIAPGAVTLFRERGIEVEGIFQRVKIQKNGEGIEIDILAVDQEYVVLIEAKSTLSVDDVKEHVERMKAFKRFFPQYRDRKAIGAVAGIDIEEGADKFAYRQGFFVIGQTGETVEILNDGKFQPKAW